MITGANFIKRDRLDEARESGERIWTLPELLQNNQYKTINGVVKILLPDGMTPRQAMERITATDQKPKVRKHGGGGQVKSAYDFSNIPKRSHAKIRRSVVKKDWEYLEEVFIKYKVGEVCPTCNKEKRYPEIFQKAIDIKAI